MKGEKRAAESSDAPFKTIDQQLSKKRVKVEKTKPVRKINDFILPEQVESKKKLNLAVNNKNIKKVTKSENGTAPTKVSVNMEKKDLTSKNTDKCVDEGAKLAALIKKKAKRKLQRQKKVNSLMPEFIKATPEELQERIDRIVNRDIITKTARRRLAVLKKKLAIKQGVYTTKPVEKTPTMSKNTKRKLRRMKRALGIKNESNDESTAVEDVKNRAEKAANAVKGLKPIIAEKKSDKNVKNTAQNDKNEDKKKKRVSEKMSIKKEKTKVKVNKKIKEEKEHEESEDEEENESMDVSNNFIDTVENEGDDSDENEVEIKKTISKPKKEDKQSNTKIEIKLMENDKTTEKPYQNKQNGDTKESQKKSRYVLFVGNLPFTVTEDEVKKHFLTKVSDIKSVRIPLDSQKNQRGFCYVELSNSIDYEKALSLHETQFKGNRIRVQYSVSKYADKKSNAVGKNKKLHALRKQGKLAGSTKDSQKRNARRNKEKGQTL